MAEEAPDAGDGVTQASAGKPASGEPQGRKRGASKKASSPVPGAPDRPLDAEAARGAGVAGFGAGTLVAIIASSLPDGLTRTILTWAAPTVGLTTSAVWVWAKRLILAYQEWREEEAAIKAARQAIDEALANEKLDPAKRAEFEQKRVELDQMVVERRMKKASRHLQK